ncbi:hypothetical protein NBRC116494_09250 [Aurantivibrio plasticivorans]
MLCKLLLSTTLLATTLFATQITLSDTANSQTEQVAATSRVNHGLDFSQIKDGPLFIQLFTDNRPCLSDDQCNESSLINLDNQTELALNNNLATLAQQVLTHSFEDGQAALADSDQNSLALTGSVVKAVIDNNAVILQLEFSLRKDQRTVWQSSYRGKSNLNKTQTTGDAINHAINKAIEELMYDDYFVMELID